MKPSSSPSSRSGSTTLRITAKPFDFRRLVHSHGWYVLAPFGWDDATRTIARPLHLAEGNGSVPASIRTVRGGVDVRAAGRLSADDRAAVRAQVRRMLRLDDDYAPFHDLCKGDPLLAFVARSRCGGLLRSPTAFEDVVKTVCTVNCNWRNTITMCQRLCGLDDSFSNDTVGNFPSPDAILKLTERQLATKTSLGYRAKTVRQIARLTVNGKLPLDEWAEQGDHARIAAALRDVWGIGPYALNHILVLLGSYDAIPVDGEVLKYLRETHFDGRPVNEREAVAPYERYGRFRFLAYKFGRIGRRETRTAQTD